MPTAPTIAAAAPATAQRKVAEDPEAGAAAALRETDSFTTVVLLLPPVLLPGTLPTGAPLTTCLVVVVCVGAPDDKAASARCRPSRTPEASPSTAFFNAAPIGCFCSTTVLSVEGPENSPPSLCTIFSSLCVVYDMIIVSVVRGEYLYWFYEARRCLRAVLTVGEAAVTLQETCCFATVMLRYYKPKYLC